MILPITEGFAKGKPENVCNFITEVMFLLDAVKRPRSVKIKLFFIVIYLIGRLFMSNYTLLVKSLCEKFF